MRRLLENAVGFTAAVALALVAATIVAAMAVAGGAPPQNDTHDTAVGER